MSEHEEQSEERLELTVLTLAELEELDFPEVQWLVEDLLPVGALALLVGRPKAGKSLLAIDLLASVATGESFLGYPVEPAVALYVPAEDALSLVRERLFTRLGDNRVASLAVLPADGSLDQDVRIDEAQPFMRLVATILEHQPRILVLDPFREVHRLAENDADLMAAMLRPLRQLAHNSRTTILLVHHRNKHSSDPSLAIRGSSAIAGSVDMTISIDTQDDGSDFSAGQLLTLTVEGRYGARKRLGARLGDQLRWEPVEISESVGLTAVDRILRLLRTSNATMTTDQLALETGLAKKTVQNAFSSLRDSALIERVGAGTKSDPYCYRAVPDEQPKTPDAPAEQPKFDPF